MQTPAAFSGNQNVPEYIRSLVPYLPGKPIEETQREFGLKKVVKLASNENPLGPSPKARLAIQKALKNLHRYPDGSGYHLKQTLARHHGLDASHFILGNGSDEVISFLIRTYALPGDFLVTSQAAFIAYKIAAQMHGVKALEAPLRADMCFDLPAMLKLVQQNERAKMVFIANPNNPTGTYVTADEMGTFLNEIAQVRGGSVLVVLDSAYSEYVNAKDLPNAFSYLERYPNVVVLKTFSKVYGLGGLRVGYGVALPEVIANVEKMRQPFNLSSLGLAGAQAAISDQAFVRRVVKANLSGMKFWHHALEKMKIPFWKSQGNFLLVDTERGLGMSGPDVYQACLKKGAIFRPIANYGLKGLLRISVGTPEENRFAAKVLESLQA